MISLQAEEQFSQLIHVMIKVVKYKQGKPINKNMLFKHFA